MAKRNQMARKVAKGAAGLAAVAGMVAVGAALMDEEVRDTLSSNAQKGMSTVRNVLTDQMDEGMEKYQSVAHEIRPRKGRGRKKTNKKAGRK